MSTFADKKLILLYPFCFRVQVWALVLWSFRWLLCGASLDGGLLIPILFLLILFFSRWSANVHISAGFGPEGAMVSACLFEASFGRRVGQHASKEGDCG